MTEDQTRRELEPLARRLCQQKNWDFGNFLGAGNTAATFEIQVPEGQRALKLYLPRFLKGKRGDQVRRRFQLVLDNLKGHNCPYLVAVHDGGPVETTLYTLMDRVPGDCLGKVLNSVPPGNIRQIVQQVATAAKFLEEKSLCHRDIKSDNVVISRDWSRSVLLDLGVVRWLEEEGIGGTDQGGQLPFVATAQYSSPEYMFRLVPSGPDLWRGLTFYQLGGLLHDLIMKKRLFEEVVQKSVENRYLIAYAVATNIPVISHDGSVPLDLVLLARRALEKDLSRRLGSVEWSDFLRADMMRQNEIILGLRSGQTLSQTPSLSPVPGWLRTLQEALDKKLMESGIHCRHAHNIQSNELATLKLTWIPATALVPASSEIVVSIQLHQQNSKVVVSGVCDLRLKNKDLTTIPSMPIVTLNAAPAEEYPMLLTDHVQEAFIALAARVVEQYSSSSVVADKQNGSPLAPST